ncbi:hypothetical protein [Nostoc sp.]|uniref:hypothetical protein n=1 Tax=Nostoc sp. TaxID=1180 RepID=UPI002FFA743A
MQAIRVHNYEKSDALTLETIAQPEPQPNEVLIGLTHTLRILGVLGVLAVRQIKLLGDFCVSPS